MVKEGLYDAVEHRDDIFKICRFFTTGHPNNLTSLDGYIDRMKEGARYDLLYFRRTCGRDEKFTTNRRLEKRGLEVLLLKDTIDDFWLPVVMDYKGKKFVSVTKGAIDLSKFR